MPRLPDKPSTASTHVKIGLRRFIVEFDGAEPLRIKERKTDAKGMVKDFNYWSAKHHQVGGPDSMTFRVITAAKEKIGHGAQAGA